MDKNGTKINKLFLTGIILLLFLLQPVTSLQAQTRKVKQAQRRQEQLKEKNKRKATLKHRHDIQTKEVQDRMKQTRKRSEQYNRGKKEPFFKDLFKRKKKRRNRRR